MSLPDLKSEDSVVASMLYTWITELVSNYSGIISSPLQPL